jgi:hypothetical protein
MLSNSCLRQCERPFFFINQRQAQVVAASPGTAVAGSRAAFNSSEKSWLN